MPQEGGGLPAGEGGKQRQGEAGVRGGGAVGKWEVGGGRRGKAGGEARGMRIGKEAVGEGGGGQVGEGGWELTIQGQSAMSQQTRLANGCQSLTLLNIARHMIHTWLLRGSVTLICSTSLELCTAQGQWQHSWHFALYRRVQLHRSIVP